jgi:hypothetical protein
MKKLLRGAIALCVPLLMVACGDTETEEPFVLGTVDRGELDARCDVALETILNSDEVLACEASFSVCENAEYEGYVMQLECLSGLVDCPYVDEEATGTEIDVSTECQAAYETVLPPENAEQWTQPALIDTHWCGGNGYCSSEAADSASADCCIKSLNDSLCRRHDHSARWWSGLAASSTGCGNDYDLYSQSRHANGWKANAAITAVFAPYSPLQQCNSRGWWKLSCGWSGCSWHAKTGSWSTIWSNRYDSHKRNHGHVGYVVNDHNSNHNFEGTRSGRPDDSTNTCF